MTVYVFSKMAKPFSVMFLTYFWAITRITFNIYISTNTLFKTIQAFISCFLTFFKFLPLFNYKPTSKVLGVWFVIAGIQLPGTKIYVDFLKLSLKTNNKGLPHSGWLKAIEVYSFSHSSRVQKSRSPKLTLNESLNLSFSLRKYTLKICSKFFCWGYLVQWNQSFNDTNSLWSSKRESLIHLFQILVVSAFLGLCSHLLVLFSHYFLFSACVFPSVFGKVTYLWI